MPKKHSSHAGPSIGALLVTPSGRVIFLTAVWRRLERYFGPRPDPTHLPAKLEEWRRQRRPGESGVWDRHGRRLSLTPIDRNRKGTSCFLIEEGPIEDERLDRVTEAILRLVRKGNTNGQIAFTQRMSVAAVKRRLEKMNETLGVHSRVEAACYPLTLRHRRPTG